MTFDEQAVIEYVTQQRWYGAKSRAVFCTYSMALGTSPAVVARKGKKNLKFVATGSGLRDLIHWPRVTLWASSETMRRSTRSSL